MNKLQLTLVAAIGLIMMICLNASAGTYSDDFHQYISDRQSDDYVGAIISMADRVDLGELKAELYARKANRQQWHEAVVLALQEKATYTQSSILAQLDDLQRQGLVESYRGLWLGNIVIVEATPEALSVLVQRDDVDQINPDYILEGDKPIIREEEERLIATVEPGLSAIRADEVWAMGFTGEGRLVSHLDTGVDGAHPALNARWRGYDSRYSENPEWAWFDPVTNTTFPFDSGSHGTHTMGTICGLGEATGDTIGVAFGAEWMSAGVIDRVSIEQTVADALLAFQWVADPDDNPSTVWDVPDVCSNSWGVTTSHGYPPCDPTFWDVLDDLEAAGVVVVFAAGNEGPTASSLRRPSDRATDDLNTFSVGAVNGNDPSFPIASFSSRGPSYCTPDGEPTFKPEVSAPGDGVRSSIPGGGYQGGWSGTSMATPHIAGVIALMRQANPNLTTDQIKQILLDTATDLGTEGEDNDYGMGIVDAYEAVQRALAYLEGWGTLAGQITDEASSDPIHGATVSVLDRPWQATSRADGWYYLFMPADTLYDIKVDYSPTHLPIYDVQSVTENETTYVDYALEGKVSVTLIASFGNPEDINYRSFFLKGSWDNDGFYDDSWSGDYIEIADDGEAPDETAEDGIFTGHLLLASDELNTYSWAIFSENYGGDDARLDEGADFDIPDLNPPVVPTLEVNPSGTENNFVFTAVGDNDLYLDLMPGVDNNARKWGASDSLLEGLTYTFNFQTMHSDQVTYGSGGVGGADIQFTPEVTGAYDIIFNDYDDSYLIQLTGTEGPPTFVSAQSGYDGHIPVGWLPPGTVESQEVAYDDGTLANGYYYYDYTFLMATMFVPESYPMTIDSVMIHVLTEGDEYWPWPDGNHDPVGIYIFVDDGSGYPQPDPVFYTETTCELGQWIRVDVDEVLVSEGNYWVAMANLANAANYDGIGVDVSTDYPANKWARTDGGAWGLQDTYAGDHMIRAKIFGADAASWVGYDDAKPADLIAPQINSLPQNPGQVAGTGMVRSKPNQSDRLAYYPHIISDPPVVLETEVLAGYNLYRDTSPAPFDRDMQINSELITDTWYDDWGADPYGPIDNGVLYYYQASAVYDIGGGDFVEVGPSNETTGMAENHPPAAPYELTSETVDRNVNLEWLYDGAYDFDYFNIYRKLMPYGEWENVGTSVTNGYTDVIEEGGDGTYGYRVAAVDNGDPALESEFSNTIYALVGTLPPNGLVALSGFEFAVPLRWLLPGSWSSGDNTHVDPEYLPVLTSEFNTLNDGSEIERAFKGLTGPANDPVVLDQGGPDEFGYTWIDSDEPGGPVYDWRDITDVGELIPITNDDHNIGPIDIGFDFPFYGETFSTFNICSNGWISFTSTNADYYNQPLPDPAMPLNMVAPFWDDMYPPNGGEYWYYSDGSECVISFINIPHISEGGPYTYQIILRATGTIIYQYGEMNDPLNTCTVGIQNGDGTIGLQVVFDAEYIHSDMAIRLGTGPEGVPPVHYNLYRSTSSPVPIDPGYLLTSDIPGEEVSYTDMSGIVNGQTYYYAMTATWADSAESPASNEADATPANHEPEAPTDLEAAVDYFDVNLTWEFNDVMGDFDHYNIYRKLVEEPDFELIGASDVDSYTDEITIGEDGVYNYIVTAVDNGDPELESANSNMAFAPVGNLPPLNLVATDNQDSHVPLRWSAPGVSPCTTLAWDDGTLANGYYYYASADIMASHFMATAPVQICTLWVHILTEGDEYWPWPDGNHDPVRVTVWEGDGEGYPSTMIAEQVGTAEYGEWLRIVLDSPAICTTDNFWIGVNNLSDSGPYDGLGLDVSTDYPEHKWAFASGSWGVQDTYAGDHMIRVAITSSGAAEVLSEEMPLSRHMDQAKAQAFSKQALENSPDNPMPYDTEEMLGYYIYRDISPGVPIDDAYRITEDYLLETSYDDDDVENGLDYYYIVVAVYDNDGDIEFSEPSNEEMGTPMAPGVLSVDPTEIDTSAYLGSEIMNVPMTLTNSGGLPVEFEIVVVGDHAAGDLPYRYETAQAKFSSISHDYEKSTVEPQSDNSPVITDFGGPDEFGYTWIDSDEENGPHYDWVDITGVGEALSMSDDDNQGPFGINFDFPFYGQEFNTLRICSNGWISFTSSNTSYSNYGIPGTSAPENLVAPFWDDMDPTSGGMIYYYSSDDSAIVSWVDMPHYDEGGPYTYQIILTSAGTITFQYMYMYEPLNSATIGIQDASQTVGLQIAFDQYYIHDGMAVEINTPWLDVSEYDGEVMPGEDFDLYAILDCTMLEHGVHTGMIAISCWDMNHDLPLMEVPVILDMMTDIDDNFVLLPQSFALDQNYPNPFNAKTEIRYALPVESDVRLEVYNVLGQRVSKLVDTKQQPGYHTFVWDGTNSSGEVVASGMYMYKLITSEDVFVKKMLLLK